jgi:hypothetical protein
MCSKENERGKNASVSAHIYMMVKQCPMKGWLDVQVSRSIRDGGETQDGVIQDEPVLGVKHFIAHKGSTGLKATKSTVLCQCLVISVIRLNGSDHLLDTFHCYWIS